MKTQQETVTKAVDLDLCELYQFTGTESYHPVMGVNATDGVAYIMDNGYSWFVTDALAIVKTKLHAEEFLSIRLFQLKNDKAEMVITEGNEKELYKHTYEWTDAKRELHLFYTGNVLMLDNEY